MLNQYENTKREFNKFGEQLKRHAQRELKRQNKNASGNLSRSINYKLEVHKNSFSLGIDMADYGMFVDQGVKGTGGVRLSGKRKGERWKLKKVTGKYYKFSFKDGKENRPPARVFDKWSIRRGLAPRGSGGRFTKRKGLTHAIATSVQHTGLETTNFLTGPFDKLFQRLPDNIVEAYALDVEEFLKYTIKKK